MKPEDKIYNAYLGSKKNTLYFNEIKELSKLSDSSLTNTLNKLVKNSILAQEKTKSNTFYKINSKKLFALKFSEIAVQKFNNLNIAVKNPLKNFLKNIPKDIYTIVLFGSASRKEEQKESDIDILVVADIKIKARKTGFPIYKEQNFYEVILDEY